MMAGFGQTVAAKEVLKAEKRAEKKAEKVVATEPVNTFHSLEHERKVIADMRPGSHQWVALAGHEGSGKSGLVLDAYAKDPNRHERDELWIKDFDNGGTMLHDAYYSDDRSIINWDPWVYQAGKRTVNDYEATHQRVIDICEYAADIATKQLDPDYDDRRIWGVMLSGIDLWDQVCVNNMRITDLGLSKDGIEAADNRGAGENNRIGHQWDWAIRKTRFHQLTAISRRLVKLGVRVYWETHLRMTNYSYGSNEATSKWRPDWEKASNNYLPTIIICDRQDELDDDGVTIKSIYTATYDKCKTNAMLQGQRKIIFITEQDKPPEWRGLPDLYDGAL